MFSRVGIALAVCLGIASAASAQVVRFETTVGEFDMVLNPTNNPLLGLHVDNMLQYVEDERYRASWINRADDGPSGDGFVLQMGGFYSHTRRPPPTVNSTRSVIPFDPVVGWPAADLDLSNTSGTVSLALPGLSSGQTDQDGGTSSFFINLTDNSFLDPDFTVFAAIPDMTVVNEIMALTTVDRTTEPQFGAGPGNLAFTDVPVEANGFQVFIKRAFVVQDAMSIAQARAGVESTMQQSAAAGGALPPPPEFFTSNAVPEPASAVTAVCGLVALLVSARRRQQK